MPDIADIYGRLRAVEDELADWLDLHYKEAGGVCSCTDHQFTERLHGMIEATLDMMDPELAGSGVAQPNCSAAPRRTQNAAGLPVVSREAQHERKGHD